MRIKSIVISLGLVSGALLGQQLAAAPAQAPIFLMSGAESLTMINLSNDHELYFKAYDDYSDIDSGQPGGDDAAETTYKHSVDYYGYFDSYKCYSYSSGEFVPQAKSDDKYCDAVSGDWSGNFLNWATMTRMDAIRKVFYGGYRSTDSASKTVLERAFLPTDAHSFVKYYANTNSDIQKLTPYTSTDLSICNTTPANTGNSKDVTAAPRMRVAKGNYSMWTAHETRQCSWSSESNTSNNNQYAITGINANTNPPSATASGSQELTLRVEVCKSEALKEDNCRVYPNGNMKPIGVLQEHGEDGSVKFGLMTGSYDRNKSGGVLRKNVSDFRDEVNETSDGTLLAWPTATPPPGGGIVDTLNRFRLTRYDYGSRQYNALDSCTFGQFGFNDGQCSNWGNPQSEIYLETLRYFGGLGATAAFAAPDDSSYINNLGTASWIDPLSNGNYCAPVNIIHINASTSSFDGDQLGGFSSLPGSPSADSWTDSVGVGEGVTDAGLFFVGEVTGSTDKSCSPKDLDALSDARGVCPEAPWLEGTYKIAGMAYYANQNSIRADLTDADGATAEIKVKTYGVALSPAQPIIRVPVPNQDGKEVVILPACMEFRTGPDRHNGNCAIVDFRVVESHGPKTGSPGVYKGKFMVLWESAQHGGDYDQDMGGIIRYEIDSSNITVFTNVYGASTGGIHGFGYVISGTTQDGLHIHSGHNNFDDYDDPYGLLDCNVPANCNSGDPESSQIYTLGTTVATALETPMYYATKWGGFKEESNPAKRPPSADAPNGIPDQAYEWDDNTDGLPDNYFFARNPGQLSSQLASVFETIAQVSSSASVVANSVSLQTTTRIYQARFDSNDWSGGLLSFPVDIATGEVEAEEWDAGDVIATQDWDSGRKWLTWDGSDGVPFRWNSLTAAQQNALNTVPGTTTTDSFGEDRLDYLRGDDSRELQNNGPYRNRATPLGDVVNSPPIVVAVPNFGYRDFIPGTTNLFESAKYSDFKRKFSESECYVPGSNPLQPVTSWSAGSGSTPGSREPMLYFGANDGALHAISACSGHERLAYVPNAVFANLSKLTSLDYTHQYFVDGASTVVDAFWGGAWHTVLVGSLAAGGNAVFALDVTDPNTFSEANAASIVLWEILATPSVPGSAFEHLGYTYSQPAVIKAEGHGWVAVFGNGYDSVAGKAVLYIVRLSDGVLLQSIDLESVNSTAAGGGGNGLSTVSPIDRNGDGLVDLIYAGDLKGNVWRFASTSGSGFSAANSTLLYSARSAGNIAQPITSRVAVGLHPYSTVGRMVYFGTGKYYETVDQDPNNAVQYNAMYGIWDRDNGLTVPSVVTRNSNYLQRQTILTQVASTFGSNSFVIRTVSDTPVTWAGAGGACAAPAPNTANGACGWYLDLTNDNVRGEKMVRNPILRGGALIFVTTIPSLEACKAGGDGWLMEIDPRTGGRLNFPAFDLNGDGVFTFQDNLATTVDGNTTYTPVSGKKSKVGILQPPAILSGVGGSGDGSSAGPQVKISSGTKDAQMDVTIENPGGLGTGRKSWLRLQ